MKDTAIMKSCFTLLLLSAVMLSWGVMATHMSPAKIKLGSDVELLLEVTQAANDLATVKINYRSIGEKAWLNGHMYRDSPNSPYWRGIIPALAIADDEVEYCFEMKRISGMTDYLPARESMLPNYWLHPLSPQGIQSDGFVLLTDETSISADEDYVLAVSFLALLDDLEPGSIKVFVGGKNVTKHTQISNSVLLYRQARPREGIMKATVVADTKGRQIFSDTWITQILPGSLVHSLPFTVRGSANFSTNIYGVSGDNPQVSAAKNDIRTWADVYGNYGFLDLEANLLVSSLEDSNQQSVNRYTLGFKVPNFDLFLGDYTPNISDYTLAGKNIRGLHAKFYGRYAALHAIRGESVRKTTFQDGDYKSGTFKQRVEAARLRLGSEDGFMIAFNGSRHRDVISSLDEAYYQYQDAFGDTVYTAMARENAVLSMDFRLNVPEQHVMIGMEVAGSLYNFNTIPGPLTAEDLQAYDIEPEFAGIVLDPEDLASFFVINKNMEPFSPSRTNLAWNAYLRMYVFNNFLNFEFAQTGSAFHALGTYSQPVDSQIFTISDHMSIGRLLMLSAGYTNTQDNLLKHKSETNTYHNINAQAILRIPNLPYLKTSFYNNFGKNKQYCSAAGDSYPFLPYNRDSINMSFGLGYDFVQIPYVPTQLDLSYRFGNDFSELKTGGEEGMQRITDNKNSGMSFSISNRYTRLPLLRTQLSFVNSLNSNDLLDTEYSNSSFFLKADYSLWENKIKPYISFRTIGLHKDYAAQNYNNYNLGVESYPLQNMTVTADLGLKTYSNDDSRDLDYNSTTFRLSLSQRF